MEDLSVGSVKSRESKKRYKNFNWKIRMNHISMMMLSSVLTVVSVTVQTAKRMLFMRMVNTHLTVQTVGMNLKYAPLYQLIIRRGKRLKRRNSD